MKHYFLFFFLFSFLTPALAQNFMFGIENGVNYSNIHQSQGTDQIDGLPGPVNGIFVKFEPLKWMVLQSGINHTTSYFNQKNYYYYSDYYMRGYASYTIPDLSSSMFAPPSYNFKNQNFSFLRIPLLLKLKTGGRLSAEFGGGVYYAIVTNDEFRGKDSEIYTEEYMNNNFPPLNDWGSIVAGSLNFQINNHWSVFAAGQVTNAKSYFLKSNMGKIGSSEFTFGVGYSPFGYEYFTQQIDSVPSKVVLSPHAGVLISMAHTSDNNENYKNKPGFSGGVSVKWMLDYTISFNSGVWFERKGYGLEYDGNHEFIYLPQSENEFRNTTYLSSDVNLDYLTFPFLFEFATRGKLRSDFSTGLYFSWLQNAYVQGERISTYQYDSGYSVTKSFFDTDIDKWIKNWDTGFMFGYQLEYSVFKTGSIFLGVNQTIGLVNLFQNLGDIPNPSYSVRNLKMFNRATTIVAGVNIPLTK